MWYGASVRGDNGSVTVGAGTNIQDCAVIHNETHIGQGCTIGHGAIVHGCTVGDNTLIGMGAVILDGARVGRDCIIGAGAIVTGRTEIPDGSMALGSPARVVRPLRQEEIEGNRASRKEYIALMEAHRKQKRKRIGRENNMQELDKLRLELDVIDEQIVTLFEQRMAISTRMGVLKSEEGIAVWDAGPGSGQGPQPRAGCLRDRSTNPLCR